MAPTMNVHSFDYGRIAFDLIDEFETLTSADAIVLRMRAVLAQFGYTSFLIASAPETVLNTPPIFLIDGWPRGWMEHYTRGNYFKDDPMVARCRQSVDPFEWSEVAYDSEQSPRADEVMRRAEDFKLKKGFVVPILRNHGSLSAVTMAGECPDFDARAKRAIHLIGLYAHAAACAIVNPVLEKQRQRILTEGEREVLLWTAAGKSSWEISVILNISEATVVWRIKQASTKLNAVNRTQAVVNAIRSSEIKL